MTSIEYSMEPPSGLLRHHHYPHQQARSVVSQMPSVSSSSGASGASSSVGGCRVRFVRLVRKRNESYGFSLRGGLEHGTGFFISHVEPASEAFMQGLRAGDQLLSVNNISVDKAIHREVTAMVQSKSSVILKVKSTGIIPVKEHRGDPLTWLMVDEDEDDNLSNGAADPYSHSGQENDYRGFRSSSSHEPSHVHGGSAAANNCRAQVVISCGGKVGLGCSICKGPPEKPGIFVQSVKPGGVAKSAGLRPGDQILACNDISFTHLEFAEAVYVLKSSPHLVLDILRGAGLDFVAGESSGYNSSASSIAGDQTPPSSSSDPRDSDHSVTSRLSAVSQHLSLDRSRGWKEIEAEWADAEAAEKRHQLQSAQRILRTRAQRDANHRLNASNSRSLCNLSVGFRDDDNEESTAFRDTGHPYSPVVPSASRLPAHTHYKPALRSTRSSSDVSSDTSHKIALVTSHDPHVSNIVVTGGPKNERDAVSRLEQLSSPSASRTSTLSSGTSQVTVRSSSGSMGLGAGNSSSGSSLQVTESLVEQQLRELREEQRKLQEEANLLAEERRKFEESLSGDVDDETKAKAIQDKIDAFKKDKQKSVTIDPKRAQHDKLMEEFKLAHRRMFDAKPVSEEEVKEEKPVVRFQGHQKLSRAPASTTPVNSKIIDRLNQNLSTNKVEVKSKVPSAISKNISSSSNVQNLDNLNSGHEINDMTSISKRKEMFNNMSVSGHKPSASLASRESQQQDEICRSTTPKPSVIIKTKQPVHGKSVVMEEFKMSEKAMSSSSLCPPDTYFDVHKENSSKPLVSIGTYPSPNDRPAPVKMDFLPSTCVNVDVNGTSKYDGSSRDQLQNELTSTLTRSNIRQRLHAQELPPSPIPSNSSSPASKEPFTSNAASATFTTTTIQNNNTNPSASLSSKYRGIVTDSPVNGPEGSP
ncbi:uncharacterized protein LOC135218597 isoform X4 [Macrobrachium nipponense]|uniref:uncharacterized protein LOC135218597 isoform X4 n=1 Tax=Macrobrachium nipponense TaxID=159736 RepID=UPI0030C7AAD9